MLIIGTFHRTPSGFTGRLETLTVNCDLCLIALDTGGNENAPNYRAYCGTDETGVEVGAGWNRTGPQVGAFVGVEIDDPSFGQPIFARLFQADPEGRTHNLVFRRPPRRKADAEDRA